MLIYSHDLRNFLYEKQITYATIYAEYHSEENFMVQFTCTTPIRESFDDVFHKSKKANLPRLSSINIFCKNKIPMDDHRSINRYFLENQKFLNLQKPLNILLKICNSHIIFEKNYIFEVSISKNKNQFRRMRTVVAHWT